MASIRCGTTAWITSAGPTQDLISPGASMLVTPKASIIELSSGVTNDTLVAPYRYGRGATDGTTKRSACWISRSGAAAGVSSQGGRYDTSSQVLTCQTNSNSLEGEAEHSSFATGKQIITTPDFPLTGMRLAFTLMGGADTDFALVDFTSATTENTTAAVSSLSFTPNWVMVWGRGSAAFAADTGFNNKTMSLGYAVKNDASPIEQFCYCDAGTNNGTSFGSEFLDQRCAGQVGVTALASSIELTSWDAAGATFTTRDGAGPTNWAMLFGRFGKAKLKIVRGIFDSNATGEKTINVGFPTKAYFFLATDLSAVNTHNSGTETSKWSHGTVDEVGNVATIGVEAEDAAATSDSRSVASNTHIAAILDDAGGVSWSATPGAKNTQDIKITVDDASAADRAYGLCAISEDLVEQGWLATHVQRQNQPLEWGPAYSP